MGRVIWTEPALADVHDILQFVGRDSPRYAQKLADRLQSAPRGLGDQPLSGGRVPEYDLDNLREIIVRPYRIIYAVRGDDCVILAVVHGSRDLRNAFRPDQSS